MLKRFECFVISLFLMAVYASPFFMVVALFCTWWLDLGLWTFLWSFFPAAVLAVLLALLAIFHEQNQGE